MTYEECYLRNICTKCKKRSKAEGYAHCDWCRQYDALYERGRNPYTNTERIGKRFPLRKYKRDEVGLLLLQCTKCFKYKYEIDFRKQKDCRFERHTRCLDCEPRNWAKAKRIVNKKYNSNHFKITNNLLAVRDNSLNQTTLKNGASV